MPLDEQEIFEKAIQIDDPGDRKAFLLQACDGNSYQLQEIESLLESAQDAGNFMANQAADSLEDTQHDVLGDDRKSIGNYKLLEQIGEGGFGVVYMAEQLEPIRRRVAVKIIKPGMDTKQVIARFEAERQALALMDHPSIGKILDAGATEAGRPYFVMELVRGIPITDYCAERKLSTHERLELFKEVCGAIEHAHQKGIIHRDIKPRNILVYNNGERAVPKVIDFGIAKATQGRLTDKTLFTHFHQFIGTPAYMSPEQAQMSGVDVDTRSDIYSLGVLLYEILTGKTPLDLKNLSAQAYQETYRRIREDEAPVPSKRVSTLTHDERSSLADSQQTTPAEISSRLRGDLDWIVMKALEKDRSRRYKSTDALVTDIVRHLDNEPVIAGPPNISYLFRKFVRRNRTAVLTATGIVTLLMLGTVATTTLWLRADDVARQLSLQVQETKSALDRAEKETARATAAEAVARTATAKTEVERDRSIGIAYQADMYVAHQALLPNSFNLGLARRLMEQNRRFASKDDPRHWEWRELWLRCQGDASRVLKVGVGRAHILPLPNSTKFVVAGNNNGVSVWDYETGNRVQTLLEPEDNIFRIACSNEGRKIYASGRHGRVRIWNWASEHFEETETKVAHGSAIRAMAVSKDGKWLATLGEVDGKRFQSQAMLWHLATSKRTKDFGEAQAGAAGCVVFSHDSTKLLIGLHEQIQVIHLDTLEEHIIPHSGWEALAISPDDRFVACSAGRLGATVYRLSDGKTVGQTERRSSWFTYSSDGKTIAGASGDQNIRLYDAATLKEIRTLTGHDSAAYQVRFSGDGKTLLSGGDDGKVCIWNPDQVASQEWPVSRDEVSHFTNWYGQHSQVSFSFDGSRIATTVHAPKEARRRIAILSTRDLSAKQTLHQTEVFKRGTRFSPVADLLAVGDFDGSLAFINTAESPTAIDEVEVPGGGEIFPCRFSRDGEQLLVATAGSPEPWHHVYSVTERKPIYSWQLPLPANCSTMSATGRLVATGHRDGVRLWSPWDTDAPVFFPIRNVIAIDISPDERTLVASRLGLRLEVYDLTSSKHLGTLAGSGGVRFSPDGNRLASGDQSREGFALWDIRTMRQVAAVPSPNSADQIEWSPNGNSILLKGGWGGLSLWHVPSWDEIQRRESQEPH